MKVFGKILKYLILLCMLSAVGFMALRGCQTSDQSPLSDLCATLNAYPEGEVLQFKQSDPLSDDGVLYAFAVYYQKDAGIMQVTLRYSNRLYARIEERHPDFTREDISYTLTGVSGEETVWEVSGTKLAETDKYIYHYEQYLFEGVSFEGIDYILANIHFDVEGVQVPSSVGVWYNVNLDEVYKK